MTAAEKLESLHEARRDALEAMADLAAGSKLRGEALEFLREVDRQIVALDPFHGLTEATL